MKFDRGRQSDEKPATRTETLQHANPDLYPTVVTITTILLTMPVATAVVGKGRVLAHFRAYTINLWQTFDKIVPLSKLSNISRAYTINLW